MSELQFRPQGKMHERKLGDLLPEGGLAGDQKGILAGIPA